MHNIIRSIRCGLFWRDLRLWWRWGTWPQH